jgi:hypothetical protein
MARYSIVLLAQDETVVTASIGDIVVHDTSENGRIYVPLPLLGCITEAVSG